ncbi:MAG: cysteine--tRNA ligase [Gammaproteobacteria bacterium]|nr:cysteine--tRNA ligase [Gammaproteobacteria bacterium]
MLKIYNTLTQKKEEFKSIVPNKIGMYVCGMTVYDYCHMGHARTMVAFDVIVRYLRASGYEVNYVCNITDIDDKIIHRANENKESFEKLTARFIEALEEDMRALYVLPPSWQPRATAHIEEMQVIINALLEQDIAYLGGNGDVYYDVSTFPHYGALSHRHLDQLQSGIRVEVAEAKRNPLDFVLWKAAKPAEPAWASPWGQGRPGWHIECSAMSMKGLGEHFDIHGGGFDLIFPHHENEIAQSEAANHQTFANYWMHVGFLQINKEKMSKSLGNFFTIRDVLKQYSPEVLRYFILTSHYRSPLNYSEEALENAKTALTRLYIALRDSDCLEEKSEGVDSVWQKRFTEAMDDDFNTSEALAVLFDLAREMNRINVEDKEKASELGQQLKALANILGLLQQPPAVFLKEAILQQAGLDTTQVESLIQQRHEARAAKNWALADQIREELTRLGVVIEDNKAGGTRWR